MAKTIQDLITSGTLKRGDQGMTCALEDFHVRPGFNTREEGERLHDSIEDDAQYTLANGISNMPQLKITPRDEGGVWIVDGHRRIRNVMRAIELGADLLHPKHKKVMLPIKPFVGDEDDQDAEIIKSQGNLKLTPLETMVALKRMADRPNAKTGELPTTSQIALKTGLKRQYVDALLVLARKGDEGVHEAVRKGEITADIASTIVRTHGDNSMAVITDELAKAKAQGKTKVTKGTMQQASLPKAVIEDVTHRVKRVVEAIPPASRDLLEQYRTEQITDGDTPVTLPVRELLALTQLSKHIDDVRDEQRTKAEKKAAKAAAQKDAEQEASEEA